MQKLSVIGVLLLATFSYAQLRSNSYQDTTYKNQDTLKKQQFYKALGNGYLPLGPFNLDLRFLIKYNQFEGFRTGLGGVTNDKFSEVARLNAYGVYGFLDQRYKFGFGAGIRVNKKTSTWINASFTDDLQETGSSSFLTDKRFFSFFEPRLLNINLFHRHITKAISIEHKVTNHILFSGKLANSSITPMYNYFYYLNNKLYNNFSLSTAKLTLQWSPFSLFQIKKNEVKEAKDGFPKFTIQYSRGFPSVLGGDFRFSKLDFRTVYELQHKKNAYTNLTLVAGIVDGNLPLTHLYHAYPNNINKETVLQRFSVAGLNSFETMYFNEFFSDKFSTLQLKHAFPSFKFSEWLKPQLVLISRHAVGEMRSIQRHQGIDFDTLSHLYSESGFELNRLLFAFGLSFAYRYGGYHLPDFEDNIAVKFTFNLSL